MDTPESQEGQLVRATARPLANQQNPNDWQVLGETFEAMGKVGLAMTVGFTVAAAFCKMVNSGKIKVPQASSLIQAIIAEDTSSKGKNG
jgi:hypothetical protein